MAVMNMKVNGTKERMRRGETVFGTLSLLPDPALPEIAGAAGYDFFVIDTEHVAVDGQDLVHMIRACQAADITPIVRTRHVEEKLLLWTLDSGAQGIMVPMLDTVATAELAHDLTHYPPAGRRTLCSANRAAAHGVYRSNLAPYLEHQNDQMLLIGLIETPEAGAQIRGLAQSPIDVFCVGRGDLSLQMGFPYAPRHPEVRERSRRILSEVLDAGKIASVLAYDVEDALDWMDFGCRCIVYSQPEIILSNHYVDAIAALRMAADTAAPAEVAI